MNARIFLICSLVLCGVQFGLAQSVKRASSGATIIDDDLAILPGAPGEVTFKGKPLNDWLALLTGPKFYFDEPSVVFPDQTFRVSSTEKAASALGTAVSLLSFAIGKRGLVRNVESDSSSINITMTSIGTQAREAARNTLSEVALPVCEGLLFVLTNDRDDSARRNAADALKTLNLEAIAVQIDPTRAVFSEDLKGRVSKALSAWALKTDKEASDWTAKLRRELNSPRLSDREFAASQLVDYQHPETGWPAVPELIRELKNGKSLDDGKDEMISVSEWSAAEKLGQIGIGAESALSALTEAMNSRFKDVRREASKALKRINADLETVRKTPPDRLHSRKDFNRFKPYLVHKLTVAAAEGREADIHQLIEQIGGANEKDFDGETPLLAATRAGNRTTVSLLLDKGADPNVKSIRGETAIDVAQAKNDTDLQSVLIQSQRK